MFALLAHTTSLFDRGDAHLTARDHASDDSFCACPQIYAVDSSFKSAQLFCACPMNYNHAIYKGPEEKM